MNLEQMEEAISKSRSLFETLPENTKANKNKKIKFLKDELQKFQEYETEYYTEMKKRYNKIDNIKENETIVELREEEKKFSLFKEWNEYNTPYEKMHLDYYLYQLHRYYKEDLESVNRCLYSLLAAFRDAEIELSAEDFYYHEYAKEYMATIMNPDNDANRIHEVFEDIYWKCSDIIRILETNFKSIYYRNLKKIEKYYEDRKASILAKHSKKEIQETYLNIFTKRKALENVDPFNIIQKVLSKKYSLSNLDPVIIANKRKSLFTKTPDNENELLEKLYNSLQEYSFYTRYQFVINDVRERISKKETYKGLYASKLKEIEAKEKSLFKLNAKTNKKGLFGKIQSIKMTSETQDLLQNIHELYKELDEIKFNNIVLETMSSDSSITEVLKLASSHYSYFVELIKVEIEGISIKDITERFRHLDKIMNTFYFTILNNIYISDDKDIAEIISDRYKLLNVSIEKEFLEEDSLRSLMQTIDTMRFSDYISRVNITKEDIEFYIEMRRGMIIK